jgi:hypothetical protein
MFKKTGSDVSLQQSFAFFLLQSAEVFKLLLAPNLRNSEFLRSLGVFRAAGALASRSWPPRWDRNLQHQMGDSWILKMCLGKTIC